MKNVSEMVESLICIGCGRCVLFCPYGFITMKDGLLGFPVPCVEECNDCGECIKSCPFSGEYEN